MDLTIKKKSLTVCALTILLAMGAAGCGKAVVINSGGSNEDKSEVTKYEEHTEYEENGQVSPEHKENTEIPRPQDDYYGYVNKEALQAIDINYKTGSYGYTNDIDDVVNAEMADMIQDIAQSDESYENGSNEQLVKAFYGQILSALQGKETKAEETFLQQADEISRITTLEECKQMIHKLRQEGIISVFTINAEVDYFGGKRHVMYFQQMDRIMGIEMKDIYEDDDARQGLHAYVMDVLAACGEERKAADKKADAFVYAMIDIACNTDFSLMDVANPFTACEFKSNDALNRILSHISVDEIEELYGISNPNGGWMVYDEGQLMAIDAMFREEQVENLKTWMLCGLMYEYRDFLSGDYPFLQSELSAIHKETEIKAVMAVSMLMEDQMSELYAQYYYTEEMNAKLQKIYSDIQKGYETLITDADWLSADTRESLLKKLHSMQFVYGGGVPHEIRAEDAALIGGDAFLTMMNLKKKMVDDNIRLLEEAPDPERSIMSSHIVNAAYSPTNTFTMTVAIMHAPYFDVDADYAENLGGIGMVMAHEIGHAFDSNCIDFDENGVYNPERISKEDRERLNTSLKKMEDYYSRFEIMKIYHVDGKKTSGENYADKGAMECLMTIVTDENERKKLFENYARIWMNLEEDKQVLELLLKDEHSPNLARVNAVLSSTPEFYKAYQVKEGDKMYVKPKERVSRWKME